MSSDTELRDPEGNIWSFENIKTQGYLDGHLGGLERCIQFLEQKSVELFKRRKHQAAISLQEIAVEMSGALNAEMRDACAKHMRQHPEKLRDHDEEVPEDAPVGEYEPVPVPVLLQEHPSTRRGRRDETEPPEEHSGMSDDDDIPF